MGAEFTEVYEIIKGCEARASLCCVSERTRNPPIQLGENISEWPRGTWCVFVFLCANKT